MEPVPTFWCDWTGIVRVSLRRFTFSRSPDGRGIGCPAREVGKDGYQRGHEASAVAYDTAPRRMDDDGNYAVWPVAEFGYDHELWPTVCEACSEPFPEEAEWQVNQDEWLKAPNIGQWTQRNLPVGAMFDAWWLHGFRDNADGIHLTVVCPPGGLGAQWNVDSRASNCGRPDDDTHRCWCRHGDPRTEPVTVDKGCDTCVAGAGSIQIGDWHGFLRAGALVL